MSCCEPFEVLILHCAYCSAGLRYLKDSLAVGMSTDIAISIELTNSIKPINSAELVMFANIANSTKPIGPAVLVSYTADAAKC